MNKEREVEFVKVGSVALFHHLLATAPFGVLRGMGAPHVRACKCTNCRAYRHWQSTGRWPAWGK